MCKGVNCLRMVMVHQVDQDVKTHVYIHLHIHVHVCVHIYMYRFGNYQWTHISGGSRCYASCAGHVCDSDSVNLQFILRAHIRSLLYQQFYDWFSFGKRQHHSTVLERERDERKREREKGMTYWFLSPFPIPSCTILHSMYVYIGGCSSLYINLNIHLMIISTEPFLSISLDEQQKS